MEISNQRILLLTPSCWLRHLLCRWIRERRRGTILSLVLVEISDVLYKMLNYFFFFLTENLKKLWPSERVDMNMKMYCTFMTCYRIVFVCVSLVSDVLHHLRDKQVSDDSHPPHV